jgi:hypothetical protein
MRVYPRMLAGAITVMVRDAREGECDLAQLQEEAGGGEETGLKTGLKHARRRTVGDVSMQVNSCERVRNNAARCMTGTR